MKICLKNVPSDKYLVFELPQEPVYRQALKKKLDVCALKTKGYVSIEIDRPYKPRSTGVGSQNNLAWKLISIIAEEIGDDSPKMSDTEKGVKERAISRGYPCHINKLTGEREPESMTKINTVECSYLIETAYQIIAELGIVLPSELTGANNGY